MSVETLGKAFQLGWRFTMRCAWGKREGMKTIRQCIYRRELALETLVATRGRDFRYRAWRADYAARAAARAKSPYCSTCHRTAARLVPSRPSITIKKGPVADDEAKR